MLYAQIERQKKLQKIDRKIYTQIDTYIDVTIDILINVDKDRQVNRQICRQIYVQKDRLQIDKYRQTNICIVKQMEYIYMLICLDRQILDDSGQMIHRQMDIYICIYIVIDRQIHTKIDRFVDKYT